MSSSRRPDSHEECDYPHPPPWVFREAPLTLGQVICAPAVYGFFMGAIMGGGLGLAIGFLASALSDSSAVESIGVVLLFALGGALAGGCMVGTVLVGVLGLLIGIEWLFNLVTRPFRSSVDPDAGLGDPW